jgi:hypothetical protein
MDALDRLEEACQELAATPYPPDAESADVIGRLANVSRIVNDYKRALLSELSGPTRGDRYQILESNVADRSYNSARLIHSFHEAGYGLTDLVARDAVRLSWQWTNLLRAARDARVDLTITQREIEDTGEIDGPHIGEVWRTRQEVKGVS